MSTPTGLSRAGASALFLGGLLLSLSCAAPGNPTASMPQPAEDAVYLKKPIYATWIMIYNGSSEKGWWNPSDFRGCKVLVDDTWQSINWSDKRHIQAYGEAIRDAGVHVVIVDFTNGLRWQWQAQVVQAFCHANGMKLAIAIKPHRRRPVEAQCRAVWEHYAGPESPLPDAYFYKDGKPLVVLYTSREGYADSVETGGEFRSRFATVWASGEDSDADKWGWQLEPTVGPVPSRDAMFVTGSIKYGEIGSDKERGAWRNHLSWLDYGFLKVRQSSPHYVVVGAFDDVSERNGWMVVDTKDAANGFQRRDRWGALSRDAHYNRVREWLKGEPSVIGGGMLRDGAYFLKASDGRAILVQAQDRAHAAVTLRAYRQTIDSLVWCYHLGHNTYRLIKLNAGLAFESDDSKVMLNWDSDKDVQRWRLEKSPEGYRLINRESGEALSCKGNLVITEPRDDRSASQQWSLIPESIMP